MRTYYSKASNFTIAYPSDWEVVLENAPQEGDWVLAIAIAGKPLRGGRPGVSVLVHGHVNPNVEVVQDS